VFHRRLHFYCGWRNQSPTGWDDCLSLGPRCGPSLHFFTITLLGATNITPFAYASDNEFHSPCIGYKKSSLVPQKVSVMKRLLLVSVVIFAVTGYAEQTTSQNSATKATVETKPPASTDSPQSEDQKKDGNRKWHLRLDTVAVGAGYGRFSRPFYPYGFYPSFYSSLYWDPYWGNYYPPGYFGYNGGKGEVRLSAPKEADVYVDNAYAGKAKKLKSIWLQPGAYDLSVSDSSGAYHQRIYVLSGKSLKITAKLEPQTTSPKSEPKP
jgi:hypothetical protein